MSSELRSAMIDDSTEGVGPSSVDPSLTTISSSEGAEASTPRGGWDAWAPWGLGSTSGAMDDVPSEGGESLKAPSPEMVSFGTDALASTSWGGGDSKALDTIEFWASGSDVRWEFSGEPEGDPEVSLRLSEDLVFFPGATE